MAPRSLELCTGRRLQYELFLPCNFDPRVPIPFLVSVSGAGQRHVNGFSRRLPSENWAVVVPLRPEGAPLFFEGNGSRGGGVWQLHELCQHLLKEFRVDGGRFLMVGVSNGGNSVLRFATLWPRLCCGLVVVTGCLQGMVSLPDGLRTLQGIPVDMYVGTEDECGFYEPMVALAEHFKSVGHKPAAQLQIFRGAGHCCSPLIDDYLLHGKICLMLLRAGTAGSQVNLSIPKETRMTSGDVLSSLGAFSDALGLQWSGDGKNGLEVWASSAGALRSSIGPPALPAPGGAADGAPRAGDFAPGEELEVWSNSQQRWVPASVVKVLTGRDESVTVNFESEQGGLLTKTVPIARAPEYLRRPCGGSGRTPPARAGARLEAALAAAPDARPFVRGERLAVWSSSGQSWFEDGEVTAVGGGTVMVVYSAGSMSKAVPLKQADRLLRRAAAGAAPRAPAAEQAFAATSAAVCPAAPSAPPPMAGVVSLPAGSLRREDTLRTDTPPASALGAAQRGGPRRGTWSPAGQRSEPPGPFGVPLAADGCPVPVTVMHKQSAPLPEPGQVSRALSEAVARGQGSTLPAPGLDGYSLPETVTRRQGSTLPDPGLDGQALPEAVTHKRTLMLPDAGAFQRALVPSAGPGPDRTPPSGGLTPGSAARVVGGRSPATGSLSPFGLCGLTAGCLVAVWSESKQKWFTDGTVAEVKDDALFVTFGAGGAMGKWITAATSEKVLRRLEAGPRQIACH